MQLRVTCSYDLEDGRLFLLLLGSDKFNSVGNIPDQFFSLRETMLVRIFLLRAIHSVSCIMQSVPDITGK